MSDLVTAVSFPQTSGEFEVESTIIPQLFYKHPVYKQLALGWKISKQLLVLNPISLATMKITS